MLALSMVVIAGMVGAGGLGDVIILALAQLQVGTGFEGGLAVVTLAVVLDRLTDSIGARSAPRRRSGSWPRRCERINQSPEGGTASGRDCLSSTQVLFGVPDVPNTRRESDPP